NSNNFRAYGLVGLAMGTLVSGTDHLNYLISKHRSVSFGGDTTYAMQYSNSFNWAIVLGLGISEKLDSGPMLFLNASYWYGLTNLYQWYRGYIIHPRHSNNGRSFIPDPSSFTSVLTARNICE